MKKLKMLWIGRIHHVHARTPRPSIDESRSPDIPHGSTLRR
ncbi:MAG: hypothetical protein ACTSUE_24970 [Promethearchaeota archaeon]